MNNTSSPGRSFYFMGIGGTGMSSIAHYLLDSGFMVHGSDRSVTGYSQSLDQLTSRGVSLYPQDGSGPPLFLESLAGHSPNTEPCFVRSKAVEDTVADVVEARRQGYDPIFRSDLLAQLFNQTGRGVAIAGTAGKSTVTGMTTHLLRYCGMDPATISGAPVEGFPSGHGGTGPLVIEADESDLSLTSYRPLVAVLLNLMRDHHENQVVERAFQQFVENLLPGGALVFNLSCPFSRNIAQRLASARPDSRLIAFQTLQPGTNPRTQDYLDFPESFRTRCALTLASRIPAESGQWQSSFELSLHRPGQSPLTLEGSLPFPGHYQISNGAAAFSAALACGADPEMALAGLSEYPGIYRRFQLHERVRGVDLVDDFAHHPSEIRAALDTALDLTPSNARVHAVYQPHGFGPTRFTFDEMVQTLSGMDSRVSFNLTEIFYGGGTVSRDISSAHILEAVRKTGSSADLHLEADFNSLAEKIGRSCRSGDLVLVMGARDINRLTPMIARELKTR